VPCATLPEKVILSRLVTNIPLLLRRKVNYLVSKIRRTASYYLARAPVHVCIASSMGVNLVLITPALFIIFRNAQDKIPKGRAAQLQLTGRPHNSVRTRLKTAPVYPYIESNGGGDEFTSTPLL
jgi:hypothetical protein